MENNVINGNENISSENEENETMNEEQEKPSVKLSETNAGTFENLPDEIAAIEIPESDIEDGMPETEDEMLNEIADISNPDAGQETQEVIASPVLETEEIAAPAETIENIEGSEDFVEKVKEELEELAEEQREAGILKNDEPEFAALEENQPLPDAEMTEIKSEHLDSPEDHDDEIDHDETGHEHDMHAADDESFEGMTKEQLLEFVINAASHTDGRNMNKRVQLARFEFNKIIKEARNEALEAWKTEGHAEAEFVPEEEPLLRDFNSAFKAYKKSRADYIVDLNIQKEKNLELKKEVLEKLKTLTESNEHISSFNEFKKLQDEWRKIGHVPIADAEKIWNSYNFYINKFYEQRSLYSEFRDLDSKRNLTAKEEVVARIEALFDMEDVNESFRLLKVYQDDWKHVGPVPKESIEALMTRYKNAVIRIYEKKEKQSEQLMAKLEQNYEAKLALISKIEEIAEFKSERVQDWITKNQELSQWIENWRSIGNIPYNKGTEIKDRFSEAIKKFNKTKNNFFKDRKKEQSDNISKKTQLCEKIEAMLQSTEAPANKKDLIEIQNEWKKSGPVPPKFSEKLWKRFQTASDAYFAKIISSQSDAEKEQYENLKLKNEIIERIEALIKAEEIEAPEQQIKTFQDEFNAIGYVPYKEKDKVRKHFFAALNNLIAKVGAKSSPGQKNELMGYRLTVQSWAQEQGGGMKLEQEEKKNARELKRLESEVATLENNIEFFRNSKNAGDIRAKMETQIADLKDKINEYQEKLKVIRHSSRR